MKWTPMRLVGVSALGTALLVGGAGGTAIALTSGHAAPVAAAAPAKPAAPAKTTAPAPAKTATPAPAPSTPAAQAPPAAAPTPNITIINNPPAAGSTVYVPVPQYNVPSYVSVNEQVVQQYYDDLNSQNFAAAWALGGNNLNGNSGYAAWVAGYNTTVPGGTSLSTWSFYPNSNAVQVTITALQINGSTNTYQGSYTVYNGVITGASIVQTG